MDGERCRKKPEGVMMTGSSTMTSMVVMKGWYRFSDTARMVYKCPLEPNCISGSNGTVGQQLCREGSSGFLCSVCDSRTDTSYYKDDTEGCLRCSSAREAGGLTALLVVIAVVLLILALLAYVSIKYKRRIKAWRETNAEWLNKFSQKFIVFMIFTQIVVGIRANHTAVSGTPLAEPYNS
mmetsp:Transcript_70673/g.197448  ORF Transcript_70673/g.197448 Transcript_70673/m.197448 type:complete len:180 (-) Transcript_70673:1467-2006(-)